MENILGTVELHFAARRRDVFFFIYLFVYFIVASSVASVKEGSGTDLIFFWVLSLFALVLSSFLPQSKHAPLYVVVLALYIA